MTMTIQTAFRLEPELIARLKNRARLERKSVNQFVEETLWRALETPLEDAPLKLRVDAADPIPDNILSMTTLAIDDSVLDEKAKYILDKGR